jgi:two-component system, NarL family, sensor histidine kinase UhpB
VWPAAAAGAWMLLAAPPRHYSAEPAGRCQTRRVPRHRRADPSVDPGPRSRRYVSLFQRVAAINALLLLLAVALTIVILAPGHESSYRLDEEGVVLIAALVLVVLLNLALLRRVVGPVQRLTALARGVDLTDPMPAVPDAEPSSEAGELSHTFHQMLVRLQAERREATGRVLRAQEDERLRIAQELHDQVGQELTAALLLLSRLCTRAPEALHPAVLEVQSAVRTSLEDVRRIAIELRPEALDDLGLASALSVLCDRFAERSGLEVTCAVAEALPDLPASTELVIYRVAQEALTNVARHSGSRRAELSLEPDDGGLLLTVRDHGRGVRPGQPPGSGMRGMHERAGLVGAALQIRDAHPGTEVSLRVPIGVE